MRSEEVPNVRKTNPTFRSADHNEEKTDLCDIFVPRAAKNAHVKIYLNDESDQASD
jgi:hypothetical protein